MKDVRMPLYAAAAAYCGAQSAGLADVAERLLTDDQHEISGSKAFPNIQIVPATRPAVFTAGKVPTPDAWKSNAALREIARQVENEKMVAKRDQASLAQGKPSIRPYGAADHTEPSALLLPLEIRIVRGALLMGQKTEPR